MIASGDHSAGAGECWFESTVCKRLINIYNLQLTNNKYIKKHLKISLANCQNAWLTAGQLFFPPRVQGERPERQCTSVPGDSLHPHHTREHAHQHNSFQEQQQIQHKLYVISELTVSVRFTIKNYSCEPLNEYFHSYRIILNVMHLLTIYSFKNK